LGNVDIQALPSGFQGNQFTFEWWAKHETMFLTIGFLA
jgi:hypothetical protein